MRPWNFRAEAGSAILEFIVFILLGQLLVFAGSLTVSQRLVDKVELQSLASSTARSLARNLDYTLPSDVVLKTGSCSQRLICLTLTRDGQTVPAVSLR